MKKVALYSSSNRARRTARETEASAESAQAPGEASPPASAKPPGRARSFYRRFERPLLVVGGALFAVALVLTYAKTRPAPYELTQKDIDSAVLHTLENTNLPSMATKAVAAIAPSVVRVMGYSPDNGGDEDKAKGDNKGKSDDKAAGNVPDKGKTAKDKERAAAKDKSARNDGGKQKAPEGAKGGKDNEKDKDPAADKDDKEKAAERNGGFPGYRSTGVGTGVVIVDNGTILTNLHVVLGAEKIKVRFFDGMESEATVIGVRPEHDLAVLKAKAVPDDMVSATLRSTADLQVGDEVVAVGFPFGIGPSASAGIVSGLKREYHSPEGKRVLTNLIQFDAAANPGNSGGPLVTADGEVVGIVTGILNPTNQRVFIGIGFAVPIENAAAAVGMSPF
ncbi:MAG TPA: trypsin-like peptidase domain-containing protein [Casimicrobiaceae bacterium]|nr:trypsin-like peptidase domain-containing protein [Casimicrobiaceae bacterium]